MDAKNEGGLKCIVLFPGYSVTVSVSSQVYTRVICQVMLPPPAL
jgi:hypothetical protein